MNSMVVADGVSVLVDREMLLAPTTFEVAAGQALAVTGSNGSGKTTLLRVLAGLTRPTSGRATIDGKPVKERSSEFRAAVAALIGMPPLARNLTLREHLTLVGCSWGVGFDRAEEDSDNVLQDLDIRFLSNRYPHELSSGQSQIFSLALVMARPSKVLILDEPEQRLDAGRVAVVASLLRRFVDDGVTLVLASHNEPLVEQVADSVLPLRQDMHETRR